MHKAPTKISVGIDFGGEDKRPYKRPRVNDEADEDFLESNEEKRRRDVQIKKKACNTAIKTNGTCIDSY